MNLPTPDSAGALQKATAGDLSPFAQSNHMWLDPNADADAGISFVDVLHSLRRRWLVAILIGSVVGTLLAAVSFVLIPVTFEAQGLLRVRMSDQDLMGGRSMASQQEYEVFKQTQAALLKSPFVLNAALRDPAVQATNIIRREDNAIEYLANNIRANYSSKSELLTLSLRDDNPDEAVIIVDAVLKAYQEEVEQSERNDKFARLEALQTEWRDNRRSMQELGEEVYRLAQELGTSDSEEALIRQQIELKSLQSHDTRRQAIREKLDEVQSVFVVQQTVMQNRDVRPHQFDVEMVLEKDPEYARLKEEYDYYDQQMSSAANTMKSGSPLLSQLQNEMGALQRQMDDRRRELRPRIEHLLRSEKYGVDENVEAGQMLALQAQTQMYTQQLKLAQEEYDVQLEKVQDMSGFSSELETKKSEMDGLNQTNMDIGQEIARLKLNLSQPSRIQLLQNANVPESDSRFFKLFQVAGAWMSGFVLTLVGITGWDYLARRLNSTKDIEKSVALGVIGSLPQITGGFSLFGKRNLEAAITDSVDSLRAAITYGPGGKLTKSVVVTSALGGEGKSTVASQLAVSLARSGRRTILVDGDVRKPSQHAIFGMPSDVGLCDILRGQMEIEGVVQATPAENLWIMPAGRCDNASFQALSGSLTTKILEALTAQFDFVVVDAGPVLTGPEALIFGQHVDGAILSTRRDVSRVPKIEEAKSRLSSVGIRILGAVVNGTATEVRESRMALATT